MNQGNPEVDSRPQWSPSSHYVRNTSPWDKPKSQGGHRPDTFQEYPRMLYRALRKEDGAPLRCNDPEDEQFSRRCQLTVENPSQFERAKADGWRETPDLAITYVREQEDAKAVATAHRHFEDRRLGEKAKAEATEVDQSTAEQVAEVTNELVGKVREDKRRRKTV